MSDIVTQRRRGGPCGGGQRTAGRVLQDADAPTRRATLAGALAAAGTAVVVVLLALWLAGSAAPPLLGDPGAVVRWGLPTTTAPGSPSKGGAAEPASHNARSTTTTAVPAAANAPA